MKKRLTAMLMAGLMMTLCACGAKSAGTDVAASSAPAEVSTAAADTSEEEPAQGDESQDAISVVEEVLASENEVIGSIEGGVYTNRYFDLQYTVPASWMFATREEANNVEAFDAEEMLERINAGEEYYDMFAQHPATGSNVIVMVQGLSGVGALVSMLDTETIIDESIAPSVQSLEAQGATNINAVRETVLFRGEEVPCLTVTSEVSGMQVFQKMIYLIRDDYIAAINVTLLGDTDTASYLAGFSRIQ